MRACIPVVLFVVGALLSPGKACGKQFLSNGPLQYGDDTHLCILNPYPAIPVSSIPSYPPGQCDWINTGVAAFMKDNPADGSGPSGQGWMFHWAGQAAEAKVEAGLTILDYYPWVVTPPEVDRGDGHGLPQGDPNEMGGAVLNVHYTPQPGAPAISNFHWLQADTGTRRGLNIGPILDNNPNDTTTQSATTPFYDTAGGAAGTLSDGTKWFLDRPQALENEVESNPVAALQYQLVVADDKQSMVNGVTQNDVTLYGGLWWGYTYETFETPEPLSLVLLTLGGSGLLLARRMTARSRAAG